jgi:hypothetical protein
MVSPGERQISMFSLSCRTPRVHGFWNLQARNQRHAIYLDLVTVATAPEGYASRVTSLYPDIWQKLHFFVLEPHDLALTKLERNFERDRADVSYIAIAHYAASSHPDRAW